MKFRTFPFRHNRNEKGLVRPYNKTIKPLPETGIICAVKKDLDLFRQRLSIKGGGFGFLMSHIYKAENICLAGPYFGSPYAAAIVETLCDCGVNNIIAVGWCGSINNDYAPGDIIIPNAFISEDSTFKSYMEEDETSLNSAFSNEIKNHLKSMGLNVKSGKIWTTDSIYRETSEKVEYFNKQGCVCVEMENSAIYSAADFLGVNAVCINIVSDVLHSENGWKPCFSSKEFKESRIKLINGIINHVNS